MTLEPIGLLCLAFIIGFLLGNLRMYRIGYKRYKELDKAHKELEAKLYQLLEKLSWKEEQ